MFCCVTAEAQGEGPQSLGRKPGTKRGGSTHCFLFRWGRYFIEQNSYPWLDEALKGESLILLSPWPVRYGVVAKPLQTLLYNLLLAELIFTYNVHTDPRLQSHDWSNHILSSHDWSKHILLSHDWSKHIILSLLVEHILQTHNWSKHTLSERK